MGLPMSSIARGLRPAAMQSVSEWSDEHRILAGKASSEPGPWRTSRTPYLALPMDLMGPYSAAEMVVLVFPAQSGKTEASMCVLAFMIANDPAPIMTPVRV